MSLLESMRSGSDSTFMQVVMALVVVSFVGMYGAQQGQDKSQLVATVNGKKIMSTDHNRAYRNALAQAERRYNRTLGNTEQQQIWEQVKQTMIEDEVVLQAAVELGLEVSDTEVARELLRQPYLRNEDGEFDDELYGRFLKRYQYTRAKYEQELRDDMLRLKLKQLVYMGATISEPAVREAYVESRTMVDLKYVRVNPSTFSDDLNVTDEEIASWLVENEEGARETYDRDFDRLYDHPEQIQLSLIRLGIENDGVGIDVLLAEMRKIKEAIEGGAEFDDMVRRWSDDPSVEQNGDIGLRPVKNLPVEQSKLEGVATGHLTDVITSDNDVRLYRVDARVDPSIDAFDDVKNDIARTTIKQEQLPGLAAAFAEEQLLPKWQATGEPPTELLDAKMMRASTTGLTSTQPTGMSFGPPPAMLKDSRSVAVNEVLPKVYENLGAMFVGQLTERKDADMEEFEADRDRIAEQVLLQRRNEFFEAWVADAKSLASIQ